MKHSKFLFDGGTMSPAGMVSVSQLQSFMSCPKKWEYGYVENLTPRVERPYLSIGKLCHKGMQEAMRCMWENQGTTSPKDRSERALGVGLEAIEKEWTEYMSSTMFLEEEIPEQERILADARSVFEQAFREFEPEKYEVLTVWKHGKQVPALELHFKVPCAGSKGLHGFIDAILLDTQTNSVWCTDYKFRKSLSPDDEEAVNIQNAVYMYACAKLRIDVTGTMTWQHCNTPAADPAILKSGQVSRAKIKTTWEHYKKFCLNMGIDPAPYAEEMSEKLADVEWFRPTYEYRNPITVTNIWKSIVVPASYAVKAAHTKAKKNGQNPRHMYPWNCKMCQFKNLCLAELREHDADFLRRTEFVTRGGKAEMNGKNILDNMSSDVL